MSCHSNDQCCLEPFLPGDEEGEGVSWLGCLADLPWSSGWGLRPPVGGWVNWSGSCGWRGPSRPLPDLASGAAGSQGYRWTSTGPPSACNRQGAFSCDGQGARHSAYKGQGARHSACKGQGARHSAYKGQGARHSAYKGQGARHSAYKGQVTGGQAFSL